MKQFMAACILFVCLTVGALSASVVLTGRTEGMYDMAAALQNAPTAERTERTADIQREWDRNRFAISLVVSHNEFDKVEHTLTDVCTAAKIESGDDFAIAAAELCRALEDLQGILAISWDNIL